MRKESVQKFDLEAAFKALNEVEIPSVKGIRPNREDLQEKFTRKLVTDILVEDYYDVGDSEELSAAQEEREAEIAKAKLARIEKIVDLEAETEEDLLPSYVGKFIMQCPQCMTLFYKNEEDIEKSEENPDVVNINEPCQHCGNSSGYSLIGKVDTVGEDEAAQYDVEDFEENELDLDFDEEEASAEEPPEAEEEVATEEEEETSEDADLDLDLAPVEDEEEEVQESLNEGTISISKAEMAKLDKEVEEATKEIAKYNLPMRAQKNSAGQTENIPDFDAVPEAQRDAAKKAYDRYQKALAARPDRAKNIIKYTDESLTEELDAAIKDRLTKDIEEIDERIAYYEDQLKFARNEADSKDFIRKIDGFYNIRNQKLQLLKHGHLKMADLELEVEEALTDESLTEDLDKDLDAKLKAHNDYIEYLKKMIEDEEANLAKATNEYVKKAIQRRLDAFKADLEEALPDALKDEAISADDLPTPEEVDMEAAAENTDESEAKEEKTEKKESLTEDLDAERKLDAEEAALEKTDAEDYIVEATSSSVMQALDALEAELTEGAELTEAKFDVSDAEFKAMLKNPVFNEGCKKELEEDIPAVDPTPFEKAADAIEVAGSELTPEEQRLEDEELAAKEGVEEGLTEATVLAEPEVETTDLLADDGTMAMLIYPDRFTAEERKEKLLADPDFVKTLRAFSTKHKMLANPEDLEDGVTAEEDMYNCTFEGIEGEDLEDTLDELISYYLDIKAGWDGEWREEDEDNAEELTEAPVAAPPAPSRLKRNYSNTELIVKELKADPLFAGLSIRTIQRILLPYYISNMGRGELSAQAMIDFFTEEGFAPYALDHFQTMDPIVRKELLKADPKFMKIFDAWAKEFKAYPSNGENIKDEANSPFDYAFNIIFDCTGDDGIPRYTKGTRDAVNAFGVMYVNGEFDKTIVDKLIKPVEETGEPWEVVEALEDFDDETFNKLTENYLTTVYSNVKSFEATGCDLKDGKLIIEGMITFNSSKTKSTTFEYEAITTANKKLVLEGLNADFSNEKAFTLNCKVDTENCLVVESLNYKYTINNTLVEGLIK